MVIVDVQNFSKHYAGVKAVRNISFQIQKGEIVGFLGPNGAGKSSTMRSIAGYLPPTHGSIKVEGYDVVSQSLEVRRRVGYMPENVPLYNDMRVRQYLHYRARLKGVPASKVQEAVRNALEKCSLKDVQNKIIGHLSKGYRQRVGLADALIHDPSVLILDEPTIGLDPHQIRAVRDLIKEIGKQHTIILSSHILHEVEMTCNRVIIIHRGKIEASDSTENLTRIVRRGVGGINIELSGPLDSILEEFKRHPQVDNIQTKDSTADGWFSLHLTTKDNSDIREDLYQIVRKNNWNLRELSRTRTTLEDVFVELTQD
ncbi:MAG: ABC transporter ATP-binding protein [Methylacidiphilales bacterium]|nr:ABC transporter ATP-binding protein [Candidatus Methylacidiphilales bacterium]MDW8348812.1 ATP-binding cassette domain-containing protein [Verrucomicrobiae bacterium]